MENTKSLTSLKVGQSGKVERLTNTGTIKRRLQDIGLITGTKVKCVLESPSKDPMAYQIKGAVIALRREDAKKIFITCI